MDYDNRKRIRRLGIGWTASVLMGTLMCTGVGAQGGTALASEGMQQVSVDAEQKAEKEAENKKILKSSANKVISEAKETGEKVCRSGYVAIVNNVLFFPYENHLCSALIEEDGSVIEIISEGTFSEKLLGLNVYGTDLYLSLQSGFYKMDLKTMEQPVQISTESNYGDIIISDDYLYFLHNSCVSRIPLEGGTAETLTPEAKDYAITNQAIYYTTGNGKLYRGALDGSSSEKLGDIPDNARLHLVKDQLFIVGDEVLQYDLSKKELSGIPLSYDIDPEWAALVTENELLYCCTDGPTIRYDFKTQKETDIGYVYIPDKWYLQTYNGFAYMYWGSDKLKALDLTSFEDTEYYVTEALDAAGGENQSGGQNEAGGENQSGGQNEAGSREEATQGQDTSQDGYRIDANLYAKTSEGTVAFMATDYFCLYFNYNDFSNGLWEWETVDDTTISFYYAPARAAGYGGLVFSLRAYDWGDNGYADWPHYAMAGLTNAKKYVVTFPTDVQYDSNDAGQTEEYQRLFQYAERIDENNSDNPISFTGP